ncbi:hypothetical protein ACOSQ2_007084 [Xanthoceras sorbifolium]
MCERRQHQCAAQGGNATLAHACPSRALKQKSPASRATSYTLPGVAPAAPAARVKKKNCSSCLVQVKKILQQVTRPWVAFMCERRQHQCAAQGGNATLAHACPSRALK